MKAVTLIDPPKYVRAADTRCPFALTCITDESQSRDRVVIDHYAFGNETFSSRVEVLPVVDVKDGKPAQLKQIVPRRRLTPEEQAANRRLVESNPLWFLLMTGQLPAYNFRRGFWSKWHMSSP